MHNTIYKAIVSLTFFVLISLNTNAQLLNSMPEYNILKSDSSIKSTPTICLSISNMPLSSSYPKNIHFLNDTKQTKDVAYEIGSVLIAASLFTGIFVAPLVSTNMKNGDVNNPRLFKWIGVGVAGLAVGIPLTLLSKGDSKKLTKYRNR